MLFTPRHMWRPNCGCCPAEIPTEMLCPSHQYTILRVNQWPVGFHHHFSHAQVPCTSTTNQSVKVATNADNFSLFQWPTFSNHQCSRTFFRLPVIWHIGKLRAPKYVASEEPICDQITINLMPRIFIVSDVYLTYSPVWHLPLSLEVLRTASSVRSHLGYIFRRQLHWRFWF